MRLTQEITASTGTPETASHARLNPSSSLSQLCSVSFSPKSASSLFRIDSKFYVSKKILILRDRTGELNIGVGALTRLLEAFNRIASPRQNQATY